MRRPAITSNCPDQNLLVQCAVHCLWAVEGAGAQLVLAKQQAYKRKGNPREGIMGL